jgi:predicted flap endonuclease-1-like 5' DNA nuclease
MDATIIGLIIGIILVAITVWLILMGAGREKARINASLQKEGTAQPAAPTAPPAPALESTPPAPPAARADDLTILEGIGPKIASLLNQIGITTFAQLADSDLPTLEKLLKENGMQFIKPASWAEQARLAAAGKMDELKALQDKLIAGR